MRMKVLAGLGILVMGGTVLVATARSARGGPDGRGGRTSRPSRRSWA